MLRRLALPLLAAVTLAAGCADDDYGRQTVSTDMSANVSDMSTPDMAGDLTVPADMTNTSGGG